MAPSYSLPWLHPVLSRYQKKKRMQFGRKLHPLGKFLMRAEIQQVGNPKKLFLYISFSQFARQMHGRIAAHGVKQSHVWRALRADRVTANEHNLLTGLNA